jgi:hypothetical protein
MNTTKTSEQGAVLHSALRFAHGQTLWFVPVAKHDGAPHYVAIERVGRKWLTLMNGYRADITTLAVEGNGAGHLHPAQCYLTKKAHDDVQELRSAWQRLRYWVEAKGSSVPDGVTLESIRCARQALGMDSKS